ncbi:DNA-binding transcriptional regulator [Hahella sp. KA22]|uniref:helix-turn-helix domain-containing protein n=1 Tax=Hahella sp. KA22 TaxID=1628392 RepID=UPI001F4DEB1B|nr:helix-turn-helix domain-containing protein [Hahella sp. KA22]
MMNSEISGARLKAGLSQRDFAKALQISVRTLQEWEQNRRSPSGSAKALVKIAIKHPEIIRESFEAQNASQKRATQVLDKMKDYLLSGDEISFSDLVLDWYREGLECDVVPKPVESDKLSLAIKASILERLVEVLNAPPHNSSQKIPSWCKEIGAVESIVKLQSDRLLEDEQFCPPFEKRNLLVAKNFMFFI